MFVPNFSFKYNGEPCTLTDARITKTSYGHSFEFADGLCIELHVEEFKEYDAVRWMLYLENKGDKDTGVISELMDCDCDWDIQIREDGKPAPAYPPVTLLATMGNTSYESDERTAMEYSTHEVPMPSGKSCTYTPKFGRSSDTWFPFFDIYSPMGHGMIAAIGWTGQWKAIFSRADDLIRIRTGLEETAFKLHPGERIRTSSIVLLEYYGKQVDGSNKFRRFVKNCVSPIGKGQAPEYPPFSLEGIGMTTEKHIHHIKNFREHGVNAEYYWIDAGWYGNSTKPSFAEWYKQVGNWFVRKDEHPDGLKDVLAEVKKSGLKFLLWFEPERGHAGTELVEQHPDWFYPADGFYLLIKLEQDEVREYLFNMLCKFIDDFDIKCYRQDFNMPPLRSWRMADEKERIGIHEIKYITNLYRLWDDLLAKYPDLVIDNCAAGGRRIDIEMMARSVPIWRTDALCDTNRDPDILQAQAFGINRFLPYSGGACKRKNDTYGTRTTYAAAYVGSWWNVNNPTPSDEEFQWMADRCNEYFLIRPYFSCDFYPLENSGWSHLHTGWNAYQYDRPEGHDGMIMVFRRRNSTCVTSVFELGGIEADRTYTFTDIDTKEERVITGKSLIEDGFVMNMPEKHSSKIILYRS